MTERMNLNMEDLEMVNGGNVNESYSLALSLCLKGHGNYLCSNGSYIVADTDKIADFFESRGWTFIPSWNKANLYIDNNGLRVAEDDVFTLVGKKKL